MLSKLWGCSVNAMQPVCRHCHCCCNRCLSHWCSRRRWCCCKEVAIAIAEILCEASVGIAVLLVVVVFNIIAVVVVNACNLSCRVSSPVSELVLFHGLHESGVTSE
ncbi:hypothetical protein PoB_005222500 [Plakobranchus ocellatus]|uniref:Uncharacterized protein n=1 Tax=Plakobranchus ocellatus TaxID=259542 RepID=A0AAV4BZ87_9GAST|nr:hypothetical protein PoB_005222500 [Plakobranchus ocellatus]